MTKTVNSNYLSLAAPGNSFNNRISADSDTFARNDIDALGNALDLHNHDAGKGLPVNSIPSGGLTISSGNLTVSTGLCGVGLDPAVNSNAQFQQGSSITAQAGAAFMMRLQTTLNAAVNNDVLYGIRISPAYNDAGHTGIAHVAIQWDGGDMIPPVLTTSATTGYLMIGGAGGTPTGVPALAAANRYPMYFDAANNKIMIYSGGVWRGVVVA